MSEKACTIEIANDRLKSQLAAADEEIDGAYRERNAVVAALAKCFPSGIAKTAIEGWDEAWHNCVYIDLPTGQASWHFHDDDAALFDGLPPYIKPWDGHSTPEKYVRLAALKGNADITALREALKSFQGFWSDGEINGLPDCHLFEMVWAKDDEERINEETGERYPAITAGQLRRARDALKGNGGAKRPRHS